MADNFRNLSEQVGLLGLLSFGVVDGDDGCYCWFWNVSLCSSQVPPQAPAGISRAPTQSVLFISERSTGHSVGLLRYLERTCVQLPPQLLSFVQGVLAAREEQKTDRPVCSYLKATGDCRSAASEAHLCQFNWFPFQWTQKHPDGQVL